MCSIMELLQEIRFYLKMPVDYENNLILYGKDTKCRNHETKIAKKISDFQSGWRNPQLHL